MSLFAPIEDLVLPDHDSSNSKQFQGDHADYRLWTKISYIPTQ